MTTYDDRMPTWAIALVVLALLAFFVAMHSKVKSDNERFLALRQGAYAAWCKLEQRTDISFEEWDSLRAAGFLKRR